MLSKKEKILMEYILNYTGNKSSCLLFPEDLIHIFEPKYTIKNIELQSLLEGLVQENYITLVNSDKNGKLIYCISILPKGKAFFREQKNIKKNWLSAIFKTVILAILSFIIGLILKLIFF